MDSWFDELVDPWEKRLGVTTLEQIGVRPGQVVLDFGCRFGRYAFPAAILVGVQGKVYALDKEPTAIEAIQAKMKLHGISNVVPVLTSGEIKLPLDDGCIDFGMAYDVLHKLSQAERLALYQEFRRCLKPNGRFSILLFHLWCLTQEGWQLGSELRAMLDEIQKTGFVLDQELPGLGVHFECDGYRIIKHVPTQVENLERGTVYNFSLAEGPGYKWDAVEYAKSSAGQQQWARELIGKLDLRGDKRLLDIGCGDGKVTAELAALLPEGSVIGLDYSPEMIALAGQSHAIPNLSFMLGDASHLTFDEEFDVVFSNATLHWVMDHQPVLAGIYRSLRPAGQVLLQMGGHGNAADVVAAVDQVRTGTQWCGYFEGFRFPYGFYGPEEYRIWLAKAGLFPRRVELIPKDMCHRDRAAFEGWFRTTWLPYLQRIPEALKQEFINQVVDTYLEAHPASSDGEVHIKMIRLEVEAYKP